VFSLDLKYISYIHIFDVKNNSMLLTAMSNQFFFFSKKLKNRASAFVIQKFLFFTFSYLACLSTCS
jgi:hypothetical protein